MRRSTVGRAADGAGHNNARICLPSVRWREPDVERINHMRAGLQRLPVSLMFAGGKAHVHHRPWRQGRAIVNVSSAASRPYWRRQGSMRDYAVEKGGRYQHHRAGAGGGGAGLRVTTASGADSRCTPSGGTGTRGSSESFATDAARRASRKRSLRPLPWAKLSGKASRDGQFLELAGGKYPVDVNCPAAFNLSGNPPGWRHASIRLPQRWRRSPAAQRASGNSQMAYAARLPNDGVPVARLRQQRLQESPDSALIRLPNDAYP